MCELTLPCGALGATLEVTISVPEARAAALRRENAEVPSPIKCVGLVDTGADGLAIDLKHLEHLDVPFHGISRYQMLGDVKYPVLFEVALRIPMGADPDLLFVEVPCVGFKNLSELGFDVLVGRDVLRTLVFTLDGPRNQFSLAYPGP